MIGPIEYDDPMDRTYIPLPGGWEVQTKGDGSSFRIAHIPTGNRFAVTDDNLHEPLEGMARDAHKAISTLLVERDQALSDAEDERQNKAAAWAPIEAALGALEAAGVVIEEAPVCDLAPGVKALVAERDTLRARIAELERALRAKCNAVFLADEMAADEVAEKALSDADGVKAQVDQRDSLRARVAELENLFGIAIDMLACWCLAVDRGTGWDYWDDHYKDAAYRDGPLRQFIDAAKVKWAEVYGGD